MSVREAIVAVLAGGAVVAVLVCAAGVLATRSAYDRLHYASAATSVPPLLAAAAVLVDESVSANALAAAVVAGLMIGFGPVVQHGTARALLAEERGERP